MKAKLSNFSVLALMVLFSITLSTISFAQEKEIKEIKANKVEKSRGENPNIKVDKPNTDKELKKPEKSRGAYCEVDFTNDTGFYVDVYLDGVFMGTISPWQTSKLTAYSGYKNIYAITSGKTYDWAFEGNCDGYFAYRLYVK